MTQYSPGSGRVNQDKGSGGREKKPPGGSFWRRAVDGIRETRAGATPPRMTRNPPRRSGCTSRRSAGWMKASGPEQGSWASGPGRVGGPPSGTPTYALEIWIVPCGPDATSWPPSCDWPCASNAFASRTFRRPSSGGAPSAWIFSSPRSHPLLSVCWEAEPNTSQGGSFVKTTATAPRRRSVSVAVGRGAPGRARGRRSSPRPRPAPGDGA